MNETFNPGRDRRLGQILGATGVDGEELGTIGRCDSTREMDDGGSAADQPIERCIIVEAAQNDFRLSEAASPRPLAHQQTKRKSSFGEHLHQMLADKAGTSCERYWPLHWPGRSEAYWAA